MLNDGWIKWRGGECPASGKLIEMQFRGIPGPNGRVPADDFRWSHMNSSDDIVAYKISSDPVNHPSHYTAGKVECIDALESATVNLTGIEAVCTANAIKYLWRWKQKNGVEDLRKARWYIQKLIDSEDESC